MRSHATWHARAPSRPGSDEFLAGAGYALMALATLALAVLVFVRHAHTSSGGRGFWTDALGYRAGVDNVGIQTVFTIFANPDLHWQHNLLVLGSLLLLLCGFGMGRTLSRRSARAHGAAARGQPDDSRS